MDIFRTPEMCQTTSRSVAALASSHANGELIPSHRHLRSQLVHAITGMMIVSSAVGSWVVPPGRAVWMPAGVDHSVRIIGRVEMRTAFVDPTARRDLPKTCEVVEVSGLLRALLISATSIPLDYGVEERHVRIMELILDELPLAPRLFTHVPLPRDGRLAKFCERFIADPSLEISLEILASQLSMSSRTLARLFHKELGMSFGEWRRRSRLLLSLPKLAAGAPVLEVAFEHGYRSPSAFAAMFRRTFGVAPSRYIDPS